MYPLFCRNVKRELYISLRVLLTEDEIEIKKSISVPLLFAVALAKEPLGAIPARYCPAH
jgi:hypothetical protein